MVDPGDKGMSNAMGFALHLQCDSLEKTQSTARPHCVRCCTNISIAVKTCNLNMQTKEEEGKQRHGKVQ